MKLDLTKEKRIVILAEGELDPFTAKTAAGIIRYRRGEVVGILDSNHLGERLEDLLGVGEGIPIVANLSDLEKYEPDTLIIGVATPGGQFPDSWMRHLKEAIEKGMAIVSGLHTMLGDDPLLSELARRKGVPIWDVRRPPEQTEVGMAQARDLSGNTVLTVGTDCNIGKKVCTIELNNECSRRGKNTVFLPTGQTGVMISGRGVAIDRVISDFVSGVVEKMVLEYGDREWIFIEGQGAIFHPSYSGVTLGLMHGACPKAMILCHQPSRSNLRHTNIPLSSLEETIIIHEALLRPIAPSKIVGISLNCSDLSDEGARSEIKRVEEETGIPTTDCIRFSAGRLVDALEEYFGP
ncbi:MAG: hypothetical protein DF168_00294 [Candidatus Moanabacter tarae]|uniref:DUF1611 domain-containing protein n=1 Tax=Candidatus Moanibacter tarae TaxID=2200854 RepID=A0A2Z4AGR4_9BACT|nr:MAG: hypothetical protein DF168_00294 [Candidatus Moanabacter tarae]